MNTPGRITRERFDTLSGKVSRDRLEQLGGLVSPERMREIAAQTAAARGPALRTGPREIFSPAMLDALKGLTKPDARQAAIEKFHEEQRKAALHAVGTEPPTVARFYHRIARAEAVRGAFHNPIHPAA